MGKSREIFHRRLVAWILFVTSSPSQVRWRSCLTELLPQILGMLRRSEQRERTLLFVALHRFRRNDGHRFLKLDKRSVVQYSHHGSIGDSKA